MVGCLNTNSCWIIDFICTVYYVFEAYSPMIWRYLDHRISDLSDKWNGCQPNADFTCVQFLLGFCHWNVICSIGDSLDFMMSGSPREVKAISYPYHRQCHNSNSAASRKTQMRHLYDMWHSRFVGFMDMPWYPSSSYCSRTPVWISYTLLCTSSKRLFRYFVISDFTRLCLLNEADIFQFLTMHV